MSEAGSGTYSYGGSITALAGSSFFKYGTGSQTFSGSLNFLTNGSWTMNIRAGTLGLTNPNNPATSGTTGAVP